MNKPLTCGNVHPQCNALTCGFSHTPTPRTPTSLDPLSPRVVGRIHRKAGSTA